MILPPRISHDEIVSSRISLSPLDPPMTATSNTIVSSPSTPKESLWHAGQAILVNGFKGAVAEGATSTGALLGVAAFGATALNYVSSSNLSGPLAAFLVVPAAIAAAALIGTSAYKTVKGFIGGLSDHASKLDPQVKASAQKGLAGVGIGVLCAAGLAGSVAALSAMNPALGSNSLMVIPAYLGSMAALGTIVGSTFAGTLGLGMMGTGMMDTGIESPKLLDAHSLSTKLSQRRQTTADTPAPTALKM